jgi:hypothetical protein
MECPDCYGYFRNATCYHNHLKSIYHLMGVCPHCHKWM